MADRFKKDKIEGEYEKPGPTMDPEAGAIAAGLSKLTNRAQTGVVLNWLPKWAKKEGLGAFRFFFFQDKLAIDSFGRDRDEMDALSDDLTQEQRAEILAKTALCGRNGIKYLALGPDDELDMTQLAALMGKTKFKKGPRTARFIDGISEEESQ